MSLDFLKDRKFLAFVAKFILLFLFLYYGTIAWIGLAAPGKYYSPFIQHYLDYVSGIKILLMKATKLILSIFGIQTQIESGFTIRIIHGRGVVIAMDCVGYGVYSFWIAYVIANTASFLKKLWWVIFGLLLLWMINITRISLFLVAINKNWSMPLNIDHHTWFNIFAYIAIFVMIWFFEKDLKAKKLKTFMQVDLSTYNNSWYKPAPVIKRVLWYYVSILFFKNGLFPFYGLKVFLLKIFGAKLGKGILIKPYVNIKYPWFLQLGDHIWIGEYVWIDNLDKVIVGNNVCISQGALLLSGNHDFSSPRFDLMIKPIILEDGVWIGAKSIVCGGVVCGTHAVLATNSVAASALEPFGIYKGNPAIKIKERVIA